MTAIAPRKPPRQNRSQQTVTDILEAAAHILEDRGLAKFNTNAVAERAGVSIGSIYQYFPGKDAVMVALVRREALRFERDLEVALAGAESLPLEAALTRLVRAAVDHQSAQPNLARILDIEERRLGIGTEVEATTQGTAARLAAFLDQRGVTDPAIAALDLANMARGMIDGALGADPADLTRRIVRAALGYLTLGSQAAGGP